MCFSVGDYHKVKATIVKKKNNFLLGKKEGPVWYTIYQQLPVVKGVASNPSIYQPTNGNLGHLWGAASLPAMLGPLNQLCINVHGKFESTHI